MIEFFIYSKVREFRTPALICSIYYLKPWFSGNYGEKADILKLQHAVTEQVLSSKPPWVLDFSAQNVF